MSEASVGAPTALNTPSAQSSLASLQAAHTCRHNTHGACITAFTCSGVEHGPCMTACTCQKQHKLWHRALTPGTACTYRQRPQDAHTATTKTTHIAACVNSTQIDAHLSNTGQALVKAAAWQTLHRPLVGVVCTACSVQQQTVGQYTQYSTGSTVREVLGGVQAVESTRMHTVIKRRGMNTQHSNNPPPNNTAHL